ncbi:MAG TPA: endonuclease [Pseudonocardiaceae bacterium]|nr:endonuclease [Pseudonocardiaceae bacterium]
MTIDELLRRYGRTYADEAGITLRDKPAPLYQLLVLTTLLSVRIKADIAVAAARELFRAGWRTPDKMARSTWQQRVDALGRAHYVRYDESTSTSLGEGAQRVLDVYHGDLRRMRADADGDVAALRRALTGFRRIGPTGTHIFCREAQGVWPELRPYFDQRALRAAGDLGLPTDPDRLGSCVASDDIGRLAAALVRYGLDRH